MVNCTHCGKELKQITDAGDHNKRGFAECDCDEYVNSKYRKERKLTKKVIFKVTVSYEIERWICPSDVDYESEIVLSVLTDNNPFTKETTEIISGNIDSATILQVLK